jgi:hypothetical protein
MIYICTLVLFGVAFPAFGGNSVGPSVVGNEIDDFGSSLMKAVAERYYDFETRPTIKVAVFDFEDIQESITVGSRYLSDRIMMGLARNNQFELVQTRDLRKKVGVTGKRFGQDAYIRDRVIRDLQADVYVFGWIAQRDRAEIVSQCALYDHQGKPILAGDVPVLCWGANLTPSGYRFFNLVVEKIQGPGRAETEGMAVGQVIFLTQPVSDDGNPWWVVRDGFVFRRKSRDSAEFRPEFGYGAIMTSHIKTYEEFEGTGNIVSKFGLMIDIEGKKQILESYALPKQSDYYCILDEQGKEYLFEFLWHYPGRSDIPSTHVGEGWKFHVAHEDWSLKVPVGAYGCTAFLEPMIQKLFGASSTRPEYYKKFQIVVRPGLNVYVVNYAHHAGLPKIFVRRLEIEKGTDSAKTQTIKRVRTSSPVYGSD